MILTESAYIESKSVRDNQVASLSDERAEAILMKIKSLYFALWEGTGTTTTSALVDYYEVSTETIQKIIQRHRDELKSDGLKNIRGKALKDVVDILSISKKTPQLTIWIPRAALRLGMLLRDSEVAKAVRTSLLNAVEKVIPAQNQELERLKLENENLNLQLKVAEAQSRLMAATTALAVFDPALPALVLGRPDAVVTKTEVVEKTVFVNERGKAISTHEGITKTRLAKRYGMKKARDVVQWLKSIGKEDILKPGLTATAFDKSKVKSQKSKVIYSARSWSSSLFLQEEKKLKILIDNDNPLPKREMVKLLTFDF